MTALANLYSLPSFHHDGGIGLSLNGQPLGSIFNTLIGTIREQAEKLSELQNYTYGELSQRLSQVEARVQRLEKDTAIDHRPLGDRYRHGRVQPTLMTMVDSVELRVATLEARQRVDHALQLEKVSKSVVCAPIFRYLLRRVKNRKKVNLLTQSTLVRTLARFFPKWQKFVHLRHRHSKRLVAYRQLTHLSMKRTLARRFSTWTRYLSAIRANRETRSEMLREASQAIQTITLRALARNYFVKWQRYVQGLEWRREREDLAANMARISARALAARYFRTWGEAELLHVEDRRVRTIIQAMSLHAYDNLSRITISKWRAFTLRKQRRRNGAKLVPHHARAAIRDHALRYLKKWKMFVEHRAKQREKLEVDTMFVELSRRCDVLASQVDLNMKTLSQTNSLVSQLVDHVATGPGAGQGQAQTGRTRSVPITEAPAEPTASRRLLSTDTSIVGSAGNASPRR